MKNEELSLNGCKDTFCERHQSAVNRVCDNRIGDLDLLMFIHLTESSDSFPTQCDLLSLTREKSETMS